jgi:hypothetical protein
MQQPFSCLPAAYDRIEASMSPARLARFARAAKGNKQLGLRLYVWNARICEALYFPMQVAEVTARNAISIPVRKRFGTEWYDNIKFINLLPKWQKENLKSTLEKERKRRGDRLTQDHMVAGLNFGFWVHLMTASYDKQLWGNGVKHSFPNCGDLNREGIYNYIDQLRIFRNEVAHHFAIFDRTPQAKYQNVLRVLEITCADTHWLVIETSRVSSVINQRPKS